MPMHPTLPSSCTRWSIRGRTLDLQRPFVMGILNVTPDSFADGGRNATRDAALACALRMAAEGADILDVGGESTRPGAVAVTADEECRRVVPVIRALCAQCGLPVSVDTSKAVVAQEALAAGAAIVNDVSALGDPDMAAVVARAGAGLVLMHSRGTPRTMSREACYAHVASDVATELRQRVERALAAGIPGTRLCLDPGFGFAKLGRQNFELASGLQALTALGHPLLVGASRKSFVGQAITAGWGADLPTSATPARPPRERLAGSLAFAVECVRRGARVVRVHDVLATCDALKISLHFASEYVEPS